MLPSPSSLGSTRLHLCHIFSLYFFPSFYSAPRHSHPGRCLEWQDHLGCHFHLRKFPIFVDQDSLLPSYAFTFFP